MFSSLVLLVGFFVVGMMSDMIFLYCAANGLIRRVSEALSKY